MNYSSSESWDGRFFLLEVSLEDLSLAAKIGNGFVGKNFIKK